MEEEVFPEREDDEKGPIGGRVYPIHVQLREVELKAKWEQKLELKDKEREREERMEQKLEHEHNEKGKSACNQTRM